MINLAFAYYRLWLVVYIYVDGFRIVFALWARLLATVSLSGISWTILAGLEGSPDELNSRNMFSTP